MYLNHLIETFLPVQSHSGQCHRMQQAILTHAKRLRYTRRRDAMGNIYLTKGKADTYPALVAHMDTVHELLPKGHKLTPLRSPDGGWVTGFDFTSLKQVGIGGDDKCGIIAAFAVAERLPAAKLAFFVDEEVGCRGSEEADLKFFADCRFILQADRRGSKDFVTDIWGPLSSDAFQTDVAPILTEFGFAACSGAMTDVQALRDNGVGISCANMSAGYHRPHSDDETICIGHLENTIKLMTAICERLPASYPHNYTDNHLRRWVPAPRGKLVDYAARPWDDDRWPSNRDVSRPSSLLPISDRFPEIPYEALDKAQTLSRLGYTDAEIDEIFEENGTISLDCELYAAGLDPDAL